MQSGYLDESEAPTREQVDQGRGLVLLEFGAPGCGYCAALAPHVKAQLDQHPEVRHIKVEDGSGRKLGRSFQVRLWPNLVFLRDGTVVRQLARPPASELKSAFAELTPAK